MLFCPALVVAPCRYVHDPYNQLLNEHSLSDTGTTEKANLTTTGVWGEKVDDLDTGDENLGGGGLFGENRWIGVDRSALVGLDGTTLVNGVTSDVHDTTESAWADRDGDRSTRVGGLLTTSETLGTLLRSAWKYRKVDSRKPTVHGNATDDILTQMLLPKRQLLFFLIIQKDC